MRFQQAIEQFSKLDSKTERYYFFHMKITSKGQITIPQHFRKSYRLHPQTEVEFTAGTEGVIIRPARSPNQKFKDWLARARGSATKGFTTNEVMEITRGED